MGIVTDKPVIIKTDGRKIVPQRTCLRRAKNGPKGLVLPSQEKNLFIQLDKDILKELESSLTS